jgi:N-methylhydantoinase B
MKVAIDRYIARGDLQGMNLIALGFLVVLLLSFVLEYIQTYTMQLTGQRIMFDYGGGGRWGNPLDRDPQAVLDDVLDEYVSVEGARRDYGVVLTGSLDDLTLALDADATAALRAEMRSA